MCRRSAGGHMSRICRRRTCHHCVCAADVDRLLGGRSCGLLLEAFVGGLAAEGAVGPMVVVEGLPLGELVVEQSGVVDDDALELAVELLAVDPVGALDFPGEPRR